MKTKIWDFGDARVIYESVSDNGLYVVKLRCGSEITDKVRCDTYREAMTYRRSFCKIAKSWSFNSRKYGK